MLNRRFFSHRASQGLLAATVTLFLTAAPFSGVGLAANDTLQTPGLGPVDPLRVKKAFQLEHDPLVDVVQKDAKVRDILEALAEKARLNLVIDTTDAERTIPSLSLKNIPLSEAFAFVLKLSGLVGRRIHNTLVISTPAKLQEMGFGATSTKSYTVYNAKTTEVISKLKEIFKARGISPDPQILEDTRTNSFILMGSQESIEVTDTLLPALDRPLPQVMVEIKLIELTKQASQQLGVSYGLGQGKVGAGFNSDATSGPGVPGSAGGSTITFGALSDFAPNFNVRLNALIQNSEARVLTNPRLAIQHGIAATFDSTTKVPIISSTATATSTTQSVASIDIGEKIAITPLIDPEHGYITMELAPDISTRGATVNLGPSGTAPEKNTRTVKTTLRVKDGDSIVIGGLMRESGSQSKNRIPFLSDIPFLGNLFTVSNSDKEEVELLIIVTPRIIKEI